MKYKLTKTTKTVNGTKLHQIIALKSFGTVSEGDLGGWIQSEKNLAQSGNAWAYGNAEVYGDARVYSRAEVSHRNHIITIGNLKHNITVTSKYIQIGCKTHTMNEYIESVIDEAGSYHDYSEEDKNLLRTLLPILDAEVKRQYVLHPLEELVT